MQNEFNNLSRRFQVGPHAAALSVLIIRRILHTTVNFFLIFALFLARSQNCEDRLLSSSCLSVCLSVTVCPHGTTRLPLDGYS